MKFNQYPSINIIRYMGNKRKLLDFIIPEIEKITNEGDVICDLMCGTSSIGYALSQRNRIISNDVQNYASVISAFVLSNKSTKNYSLSIDINKLFDENMISKKYDFFTVNYSGTYFSKSQCQEIDCLLYAISKIKNKHKHHFYLSILLSTLCNCQSTTGHFAQFLSSNNLRIKKIQNKSIKEIFDNKMVKFQDIQIAKYKNHIFNKNYLDLFQLKILKKVRCFYLDPPYTNDQYSRYYHILETASKIDSPELQDNKAKYPKDRFKSNFCNKTTALKEFENIISFCFNNKSNLIISYTTDGVVPIIQLERVIQKYYQKIKIKKKDYSFSTQGRGYKKSNEILFILEY